MNLLERYMREYGEAVCGPVSENDVDAVLRRHGVEEALYRRWLIQTGGGPIGPDWYDGIDELERSQTKRAREGWAVQGFVIGWDGAGNPIALQRDGSIVVEDHHFGGIHPLASSFQELLAKHVER